MFKSSFSKYVTTFIVIILLSFLILLGIISSMIGTHATMEKRNELMEDCLVVTKYIKDEEFTLEEYVNTVAQDHLPIILSVSSDLNIMLTDGEGNILLDTVSNGNGTAAGIITGAGLGRINLSGFKKEKNEKGQEFLAYEGTLDRYETKKLVYSMPIVENGRLHGYVVTYSELETESDLVSFVEAAIINSSVWVMLAAVIATYFVTERIIQPLKSMTSAVKKYAKGDFSSRIAVRGKDEVAELGNAFNSMAESLGSLEKMRNSFLANVSHDLRTPMTTIAGFINGITSGAIPPEKHEYYLGVISGEVHRLSRLVTQLLDVSRLESGERKFVFADFDVTEVARLILISFEQKIEDKQLDVVFDAEEDEMFAFADKDAIYQVLYNLCHNAIKFSKEKGLFRISIRHAEGKRLLISVFDEGQVVSKEETKMLFERFYKTDKSRGLDKNGAGLGLYICKTIIDAHGESIEAIPVENEGCEFRFTLKEGNYVSKRKNKGELRKPDSEA